MKYKKILSIGFLALSASVLPFYGISKDVKDTNRMLTSNILDENNVDKYVSVKSNETKAVQDTASLKENNNVKNLKEEDLKKVKIKDNKVEREIKREDNNAQISNKGLIDNFSGKFNIWLGASYTPSADVKNFTDNNIGDKYKYALTAGIGYDLFIKNVFNENITPFVGIGLNGTYRFDNLTFKDFKFNTQLNANLRLGMQFKINSKVSIRPYGVVGVSTQNVKTQNEIISTSTTHQQVEDKDATYQQIQNAFPEGFDLEKRMHYHIYRDNGLFTNPLLNNYEYPDPETIDQSSGSMIDDLWEDVEFHRINIYTSSRDVIKNVYGIYPMGFYSSDARYTEEKIDEYMDKYEAMGDFEKVHLLDQIKRQQEMFKLNVNDKEMFFTNAAVFFYNYGHVIFNDSCDDDPGRVYEYLSGDRINIPNSTTREGFVNWISSTYPHVKNDNLNFIRIDRQTGEQTFTDGEKTGVYRRYEVWLIDSKSINVPQKYRQAYESILRGEEVDTSNLDLPAGTTLEEWRESFLQEYNIEKVYKDIEVQTQTKKIKNNDAWKIGLNAGAGVDVVINDRFIVGGEYLYNVINNLETHNVGLKFGYQF